MNNLEVESRDISNVFHVECEMPAGYLVHVCCRHLEFIVSGEVRVGNKDLQVSSRSGIVKNHCSGLDGGVPSKERE